MPWLVALVVATFLPGCASAPRRIRVIVCVGDSITFGISGPGTLDVAGGYPGRLQERLGPRVRVVNRGFSGSTTTMWLVGGADGERWWDVAVRYWRLPPGAPTPTAPSVLARVLAMDRPDLVVVLLGVNDLGQSDDPAVAAAAARNLTEIRRDALTVAPVVLVATALPNRRDAPEMVAALNEHIRHDHPDFVPAGERFAAAGWERLLGDDIHPNAEGYTVLANVIGNALVERGYVASGDGGAP